MVTDIKTATQTRAMVCIEATQRPENKQKANIRAAKCYCLDQSLITLITKRTCVQGGWPGTTLLGAFATCHRDSGKALLKT